VVVATAACGNRYFSSDAPDAALPDDGGADASGSDAAPPDDGGSGDAPPLDAASDADADADRVFTGCNGVLACTRTAFVTSMLFSGKLGGLEGADAKCQALADGSSLTAVRGKRFLAWLADGTTGPTDRFPHGTGTYQRTDGAQLANGWSDLVDATLNLPLDRDENGIQLLPNVSTYVWTGVDAAGTASPVLHCLKWTTANGGSEVGTIGKHIASDQTWTFYVSTTCDASAALYCFEY